MMHFIEGIFIGVGIFIVIVIAVAIAWSQFDELDRRS